MTLKRLLIAQSQHRQGPIKKLYSPLKAEQNLGIAKNISSTESLQQPSPPARAKNIMKNILIIDDNSFNPLAAKHLLESLGYQVETALNGKLGVDLIKSMSLINKRPFDVILMDLQMPVMDGYEASRVLKKMMEREEIGEVPIIALSANNSEDDNKRCNKVGMYDHLSKPLKED